MKTVEGGANRGIIVLCGRGILRRGSGCRLLLVVINAVVGSTCGSIGIILQIGVLGGIGCGIGDRNGFLDRRSGQPVQILQHFCGGRIPISGIIGTGLQDYGLQCATAEDRGGQRFAGEAAQPCGLIHTRAEDHRGQGQEGHTPLIQQPVQYQTQGVNIRTDTVGLIVVHFRCHVLVSTDLGAAGGLFDGLGDAEVTQLEVSVGRNKDVLGLDIPVDDVIFFAQDQSVADIPGNADNGIVGDLLGKHLGQRGQQLHLDIDIPTNAVLMLHIAHIITADDVGAAVHFAHQGVFRDDALQMIPEGAGDAFVIVAFAVHFFDIAVVLGDGDDLQCGGLHFSQHFTADLVDSAVAAPADKSYGFPTGPDNVSKSVCHMNNSLNDFA